MSDIQHGTDLRMARRCERKNGYPCQDCKDVRNAYQREMRALNPHWNRNSNILARQRRRAMTVLSYRYPEEYETILQDIIAKDDERGL